MELDRGRRVTIRRGDLGRGPQPPELAADVRGERPYVELGERVTRLADPADPGEELDGHERETGEVPRTPGELGIGLRSRELRLHLGSGRRAGRARLPPGDSEMEILAVVRIGLSRGVVS